MPKILKRAHAVNFESAFTRALTSENFCKAKRAQEMKEACEVSVMMMM